MDAVLKKHSHFIHLMLLRLKLQETVKLEELNYSISVTESEKHQKLRNSTKLLGLKVA